MFLRHWPISASCSGGLSGVIKIAHLICPLILSHSEEAAMKSWASRCRLLLFPTSSSITNPSEIHSWAPDGSVAGVIDVAPLMIIEIGYLLKGKPCYPFPWAVFMSVEITLRDLWGPGAKPHWSPQASTDFGSRAKAVLHSVISILVTHAFTQSFPKLLI